MSGPIHLYVSSSSELAAEREEIGQIVAALPVTLGWQISHTPLSSSPAQDRSAMLGTAELGMRIEDCDLYALVLGQDLTAPMGFEVRSALARSRRPKGAHFLGAYRKECTQSPSARDAVRTLEVSWQPYTNLAGFGAEFRRDLLRTLTVRWSDIELIIRDLLAAGEIESRETTNKNRTKTVSYRLTT